MTNSTAIAANTVVDLRTALGLIPARGYTLQWQPTGSDELKVREGGDKPDNANLANVDGLIVKENVTFDVVPDGAMGMWAWSAGGGKVISTRA